MGGHQREVAGGGTPGRRLAGASAVVVLLGLLLGGWSTRIGSDATSTAASGRAARGPSPERTPAPSDLAVDAAVERVSHRVVPRRGAHDVLEARDPAYTASFDGAGFAVDDFHLSLSAIRRGGTPLRLSTAPWEGVANQAERGVAARVTERVTARSGEVEWDLVLAVAPPGRGDLVVQALAPGFDDAAQSDEPRPGWRFARAGRTPLRMGEVVVVDAGGAELHRALPEVSNGTVTLRVPDHVLDGARYPLTIDPVVGPELSVSGPAPAPGGQGGTSGASDGSASLVVWGDGRKGNADIYGARIAAGGEVLDPVGIPIATGTSQQFGPSVTFNGTNYLVVWMEGGDLRAARVTTAGSVLDRTSIMVSAAANDQVSPDVVSQGGNSLVVWTDFRSGTADVYGARVSSSGSVLDTAGLPISTATDAQRLPHVTFDGTRYVAVWTDFRPGARPDAFAARVATTGAVLDPSGIPITTGYDTGVYDGADVASDGVNSFIVWSASGPQICDVSIRGARLSSAGVVLDARPIVVHSNPDCDGLRGPAVAFGKTNYYVTWYETPGPYGVVYGAPVSTSGTAGSRVRLAPHSEFFHDDQGPAVAGLSSTGTFLVAWTHSDGEAIDFRPSDVLAARVSSSGALLDASEIVASRGPGPQTDVAVAFDGSTSLAVWEQRSGGDGSLDIVATRISGSGTVLDPHGITIASENGDQTAPAVVFDGTNFVIAYEVSFEGATAIRVVRLDARRSPQYVDQGSGGGTDQRSPALASDGTSAFLVWEATGTSSRDVFGARIAGFERGPAVPISAAVGTQASPTVDFDGTNYFVAWQDNRSGTTFDIYGARVSTAPAVLDTSGTRISGAANNQAAPDIAFDGTQHLVVWQDLRSGSNRDVYGARVTKAAAVRDPSGIPISTAGDNQTVPDVAFNGVFLVVWQDRRSGSQSDVYATRVDGAGAVLDASGLPVATATVDEQRPAVARAASDDWLVAYDRPDGPRGIGIFGRFVSAK